MSVQSNRDIGYDEAGNHTAQVQSERDAALQADTPYEPNREQSSYRTEPEGNLGEAILLEPHQGYVNHTFGCWCM